VPVVNSVSFRERNAMFYHSISEPLVKSAPSYEVSRASDRPQEAEHEDALDLGSQSLDLIRGDFLNLSVVILFQEAIN
jgi:hypothetical protein